MTERQGSAPPAGTSAEDREILAYLLAKEGIDLPLGGMTIPRRASSEDQVLSFAQHRLWVIDQLDPGSPEYNLSTAVRVTGSLDHAVLEQSLTQIVRRHEVLRTTLTSRDGQPVPRLHPSQAVSIPVIDLTHVPAPEREAEARRRAVAEAQRRFDLSRGPLIRAALLRLDDSTHLLLLTMHHIVSDGWSMSLFFGELTTLYEAAIRGETADLPELPIQYADFAAWQRQWLTGPVLDEQLAYWKKQLSNLPTLDLATDRPRTASRTFRGGSEMLVLSPRLSRELATLSQREGVTQFMTLLAAFSVLLHRYTGQTDIVVGSPVANRNRAEVEKLIGFFVNLLVMRCDVSGDPTFPELLDRVRATALEAYANQDLPFETLVGELAPERDISGMRLFQITIGLHEAPLEKIALTGASLTPADITAETTRFDLEVHIEERRGALAVGMVYSTDLFDRATIKRMLRHFETLLESATQHSGRRISQLPWMTAEERQQVVQGWNTTTVEYPRESSLQELFERQVDTHAGAVAVTCGDQRVTYGELNARVNRLAHHLQKLGVGPEILVGLCIERSLELVIGMLGVVKAGGAYVPLDVSYPKERLAIMLADAGVSVVVADDSAVQALPASHDAEVVCLDDSLVHASGEWDENPSVTAGASNLAYVMYTSGSTGRPKGVCVEQRSVIRLVCGTDYVQLEPSDVVAQASNASFDAATFEVWGALLNGAQLVIVPKDVALSPAALGRQLRDSAVTCLFLTTALFDEIARQQPQAFSDLRHLLFGGEAVSPQWVRRVLQEGRPERLLHVYGPTESTTFTTWHEVKDVPEGAVTVPIGGAIANTRVYVLDRYLAPVPVGVPGELYIGGDGLARGYLGQPERTEERFVASPIAGEDRLYKTGDIVRWSENGALEFLGRNDEQVKIRGYRIECGEVEAVLKSHPDVRDGVVMAHADVRGEKHLVGYAVPHDGRAPTINTLRNALREQLPDYMVPSAFVLLDALPLSPNGKVDRQALPIPKGGSRPDLEETYVGPRNDRERRLAALWMEVLDVDRVGVNDNFFELGGDSILGIQIVARASAMGLGITPKDLFLFQTIAELAAAADMKRSPKAEEEVVTGEVELTPIQCWWLEQRPRDLHHFNQAVLLETSESLDPDLLTTAVERLLWHHDALRSRFVEMDEAWQQHIENPTGEAPVVVVDLSGRTDAEQSTAIAEESARAQESLDVTSGVLVRVVLFQLGTDRPDRVLMVIHHLVVDGVSWRILLEDLSSAYRQLQRGAVVQLPDKTSSVAEWSRRLREYAASQEVRNEIEFWTSQSATLVSLPLDRQIDRRTNTVGTSQCVTVRLEEAETKALLQRVPQAYNARIHEALLMAVMRALCEWTGSSALLVDVEGHGRSELFDGQDVSRTVGWFTGLYPVFLSSTADDAVAALREITQKIRGVPNDGIGYGILRYLTEDDDVKCRMAVVPQPDVSFNYLGQLDQALPQSSPFQFAKEPIGPMAGPRQIRPHLLDISGDVLNSRLELHITYCQLAHDHSTIERLANRVVDALRQIVARAESPDVESQSDDGYPLATIDRRDLAVLADRYGEDRIEDVYPLSPLQNGMVFHSRAARDATTFLTQVTFEMQGGLNCRAFRRAWEKVLEGTPVLRTAFTGDAVADMHQVVFKHVELPWEEYDWRGMPESEQKRRLVEFVEGDRKAGFELTEAPLMRLTLARVANDRHYLIWTHHHAILDGWSLQLVLRDVLTLYRAERDGKHSQMPQRKPYREYIAWLSRRNVAAAERFWRRTLAGFDSPTVLSADAKPGTPPGALGDIEEQHRELSEAKTDTLESCARNHHITLNTLVQGAWALLLSRYSGDDDVVFGVTVSGRPAALPGVEEMVGLFINGLPVRVQSPPDQSIAPWLQALQADQAEMREYEQTPLVEVQGWSDVPRGLPLFETTVVFENYPVEASLGSVAREAGIVEAKTTSHTSSALHLRAMPGRRLRLWIAHDRTRFAAATAAEMLEQVERILCQFAKRPQAKLGEITLAAPQRGLGVPDPRDPLPSYWAGAVQEQVAATAKEYPERVALRDEHDTWTYAELDRRSSQLANFLSAHGVDRGVVVAIYAQRTAVTVQAILGVLKAGGVFVLLDPAYPGERLMECMKLCRPKAFIRIGAAGELPTSLAAFVDGRPDCGRITLPNDSLLAEYSGEAPARVTQPGDLAYVAFTSGTTGSPKGIAGRHGSLARYARVLSDTFGLSKDDRFSMLSALSHDPLLRDIFPPLQLGASLLIPSPDVIGAPGELAEWMRQEGVTASNLTPALGRLLVEDVAAGSMPSLRHAFFVGETLTSWDVEQLRRAAPAVRCVNLYGATETQQALAYYVAEASDDAEMSTEGLPLGRGMDGVQVLVLDRSGQLAGVGEVGEICVRSFHLAEGYLDDAELTADRFVANHFSEEAGDRLYRTGDKGRFLPGGDVVFLGRFDEQVKIRGFRVEPTDVELVLQRHEGILQAVVVAWGEKRDERTLLAYFVGDADERELRQWLETRLPTYMVPSRFVRLPAIPRTAAGKIDRAALPAPEERTQEDRGAFLGPRTPVEANLAELWRDVLGVENVDVRDSFFALGGHSLLVSRMVARVQRAFEIELAPREVFERPTLGELAARIDTMLRARGATTVAPPLEPGTPATNLPLSFAQERLWFLDQLEPDLVAYNIPAVLRLRGALDVTALEKSLAALVERQASLRTTFREVAGKPVQVIHRELPIRISVTDLHALPAADREAETRRMVGAEGRRPFDLSEGPLLRMSLLRLSDREHVLMLTIHHIIADGWSMGILISELAVLYNALTSGQPSPLAPLPVQYADFSLWQRAWLQGAVLEEHVDYWRRKLADAPTVQLPTDRPRAAVQQFRGLRESFTLSKSLMEDLNALSRRVGTTLFMTLLSAFNVLLHRYTSQTDLVVGSPIANRIPPDVEGLIGFFVDMLVLRNDLSGNPQFTELLGRVRETALGAYSHQRVPFEKLVESLDADRDLSRNPLFQVTFALNNVPLPQVELDGVVVSAVPADIGTARFDLSMAITETAEGAFGSVEYSSDLFDAETIQQMLEHFQILLKAVVAEPAKRISHLPMLSEAERERLLVTWNDTGSEYDRGMTVQELVEQQADARPDGVAVVGDGETLTYGELNRRANQVAHCLRRHGVGPETLVGVCADRSVRMVVGLLGTLKAGGAYVPLDPTYPEERLAWMLADSRAPVLLKDEGVGDAMRVEDGVRVLCLDRAWEAFSQESEVNPPTLCSSENLAYVIYTSGSTGRPKGVAIQHDALLNLVAWHQQAYHLTPGDRATQLASVAFDASVWELWPALAAGATIYIPDDETRGDPADLIRWMVANEITISFVPTPLAEAMLAERWPADLVLRVLLTGGDRLRRGPDKAPPFRLVNHYGPTENTVVATSAEVSAGVLAPPIGRPIANTQAYVLDSHMQPVPVGVVGELFLGGSSLARGYWRRPEMTAERFVPNPFVGDAGSRLYRTGDLVRYRANGELEFLGRNDQQVKIRGFRIELGEVEAVLADHEAVRDVAVLSREDVAGQARLVAYVVLRQDEDSVGADEAAEELRSFARQRLPDHMTPSAYVALSRLPLTPNGKIDRAALPAPEAALDRQEYVAPRNEIEDAIAQVWRELLHVNRVSAHDNFFDLGGHSLLMTQSASKLREMFQVPLSLKNVFSAPTIEELADLVLEKLLEQEDAEDVEELLVEVESASHQRVEGEGHRSRSVGVKDEGHG